MTRQSQIYGLDATMLHPQIEPMPEYSIETLSSIDSLERDEWNRLSGTAIARFLEYETDGMQDYLREVSSHSPYRSKPTEA
ncbi:MAG: hypothetical protein GY792_13105 [Gammaproteobacteria bacterium]|nr:hypothetical protein [Gammaproteobacteria bacterium]